jgi:TM2 domain-containing membrane protein YozV
MMANFCPNCGTPVHEGILYCPKCGRSLTPLRSTEAYYQPLYKEKDPGTTVVLAVVLGLIGIMGVGHLYLGKVTRGIILLILGLVILPMIVSYFLYLSVSMGSSIYSIVAPVIIIIAVWMGLLIWQAFDAYQLAKEYNLSIQTTGRPPW